MKALIFVGLKATEVLGAVFVPYWYGRLMFYLWPELIDGAPPIWIVGLSFMIISFGILGGLCLVPVMVWRWIKANWSWATDIYWKIKS